MGRLFPSEPVRGPGQVRGDAADCTLAVARPARVRPRRAGSAYAEAITWRLESTDELWARLHEHFSEPELVELGCFIALTMGQQSWLRLLDIEHHDGLSHKPGDGCGQRARRPGPAVRSAPKRVLDWNIGKTSEVAALTTLLQSVI